MSSILFLIPFLAAVAVILGLPARFTARVAGIANLLLGLYAVATFKNEQWTHKAITVLKDPHITLHFGFLNGISAVMVALSVIVTAAAVFTGRAPEQKEKLYYSSTLFMAAGAIGAFLSKDLFFFYSFHELALIPTFIMIGLLGRGDRKNIAWKITIYLGVGSMILLAGLLLLVNYTGTFSIPEMDGSVIPLDAQIKIAGLLIVGFGILISLFPFHSWAAPAYASAPAPTAMMHAGVLKKFGLYGLLQIALPLVPQGMQHWLIPLLVLLLGNIIWVGFVTINQKRLDLVLGNSSVMHMGYIFLAIAAVVASDANTLGVSAATVLMFAHGISIALLFALTDRIERSTGTLDLDELGGLAKPAPKLAFLFGLATMASIGLPGLANFSGELLVFLSGFQNHVAGEKLAPVQITTIIALWGVVMSAVYMLRAYRKTFQGGTVKNTVNATDLSLMEKLPAVLLAAALLVIGIYPNILLKLL